MKRDLGETEQGLEDLEDPRPLQPIMAMDYGVEEGRGMNEFMQPSHNSQSASSIGVWDYTERMQRVNDVCV